ncbi:hypothetical protein FIBSPDRAFT_461884 [Athelia psychrophila]|uniref:Uncharacterized protein n=1 Tax=Athelia psychrophila TaxID=1759441 RepID=A0A166LWJ0_9AGAM|nr:hypothetical protein FIBSPDRAFT_461884 [Fibularhizoctonia sp. CBS 109695]
MLVLGDMDTFLGASLSWLLCIRNLQAAVIYLSNKRTHPSSCSAFAPVNAGPPRPCNCTIQHRSCSSTFIRGAWSLRRAIKLHDHTVPYFTSGSQLPKRVFPRALGPPVYGIICVYNSLGLLGRPTALKVS